MPASMDADRGTIAPMRNMGVVAVLLAAACGTSGEIADDQPADDDPNAVDAGPDDEVDAELVGPDAASEPIGVSCPERLTRLVVHADGSQTEHWRQVARVPDLGPHSDFVLQTCAGVAEQFPPPEPVPDCPAGATCTGTTVPAGEQCFRSMGEFYDGVLTITCENGTEHRDPDGALVSRSRVYYPRILLTR